MSVKLTCRCGKGVKIPKTSYGKLVACPSCGKRMVIEIVDGKIRARLVSSNPPPTEYGLQPLSPPLNLSPQQTLSPRKPRPATRSRLPKSRYKKRKFKRRNAPSAVTTRLVAFSLAILITVSTVSVWYYLSQQEDGQREPGFWGVMFLIMNLPIIQSIVTCIWIGFIGPYRGKNAADNRINGVGHFFLGLCYIVGGVVLQVVIVLVCIVFQPLIFFAVLTPFPIAFGLALVVLGVAELSTGHDFLGKGQAKNFM